MSQEALIQSLTQAADNKQFAVAEQLANDYVALHPMEATGYYFLARCNKQRSNYAEAQAQIRKALALNENHVESLFLAADIAVQLGESAKAGEIYAQLAANPELANTADVHIALSLFQVRYGTLEQAFAAANKACAIASKSVDALLQRAHIHQLLRNLAAAAADLAAAQAIAPNHAEVLRAHIALCQVGETPEEAIPSFEALLEAEPRNIGYQVDFARLLLNAEKYEKAENVLDFLLEFDPENTEYRLWRANARLALQKNEAAISDCQSLMAFDGQDTRAYLLAADAYLALYDAEEAINMLSQAIDNDVQDMPSIYRKRGQIYMEQYDFVRAADDFQLLALAENYTGEGYLLLGKAYKEQGDLAQAFTVWQMAEEAANYEATDLIEEFCQAQLAESAKDAKAQLIADYADAAAANAKSKLIDALSKKYWRFDEKATTAKNPEIFKELPEEMRSGILDAFSKMLLVIRPEGLLMLNPEQTDFCAVYRIAEDKGAKLTLDVQPLSGIKVRRFKLSVSGKSLSLDGFAEEMEFEIFFLPADALTPKEQAAINQRKAAGELDYIGL
jgi:tetratricopeptide (TPR) repeat protein